ncbi:hypothetical protein [Halobacillus litoralis]|uniref:hypothetical protein n=1 Tax=Halobacillus litoralis TaxID=45668 RepID=UPI001CD6EF36|nr:hypothetical protein [Halobacillus litoralis]MCA1021545.1 hypothetical protein [Halobacillus litoralis]
MKIINKDNFGRETEPDYLVAENVNERNGKRIVWLLNQDEPENTPNYYVLVEDDYRLSKGLEDFI